MLAPPKGAPRSGNGPRKGPEKPEIHSEKPRPKTPGGQRKERGRFPEPPAGAQFPTPTLPLRGANFAYHLAGRARLANPYRLTKADQLNEGVGLKHPVALLCAVAISFALAGGTLAASGLTAASCCGNGPPVTVVSTCCGGGPGASAAWEIYLPAAALATLAALLAFGKAWVVGKSTPIGFRTAAG